MDIFAGDEIKMKSNSNTARGKSYIGVYSRRPNDDEDEHDEKHDGDRPTRVLHISATTEYFSNNQETELSDKSCFVLKSLFNNTFFYFTE